MNATEQIEKNNGASPTLRKACLASCRKLIGQIDKAKHAILAEFRDVLGGQEQMLHLALNEAEALAWQTGYPHLVFPTLATEKAQAVAARHVRQRAMRRTPFTATLVA